MNLQLHDDKKSLSWFAILFPDSVWSNTASLLEGQSVCFCDERCHGQEIAALYADALMLRQVKSVFILVLCQHAVVITFLQVFSLLFDESVAGTLVSILKVHARFVHPFLYSLVLSFAVLSLQWVKSRGPELVLSDVPNTGRSDFTVNEPEISADFFSTILGTFSNVI